MYDKNLNALFMYKENQEVVLRFQLAHYIITAYH